MLQSSYFFVSRNIAGDHSSGIAIGKDLGNVLHISFSSTDRLITACIGKDVWVINIQVSGKPFHGDEPYDHPFLSFKKLL